jgi:hypothetical protein
MKINPTSFKLAAIALLMAFAFQTSAQAPSYICIAKNDSLVASNIYQFDVYIYESPASMAPLLLNNYQLSFSIPESVINGGALMGHFIPGTSELGLFAPQNVNTTDYVGSKLVRINGPLLSLGGLPIPQT